MNTRWLFFPFISMAALIIAACSTSAAPQRIAAYPKDDPIARYPATYTIRYRAYMELKVNDTDWAASEAGRLAYGYGGYLVSSQSWYVDGCKVSTLELAVPIPRFEDLRHALTGLGELATDQIAGERSLAGDIENPSEFSSITLHLRPGGITLPRIGPTGWTPGRTFQRAFAVFVNIFGFLLDILIWIVVVLGPFILIGWLTWLGIRRFCQIKK